jgi:hypothetical protein
MGPPKAILVGNMKETSATGEWAQSPRRNSITDSSLSRITLFSSSQLNNDQEFDWKHCYSKRIVDPFKERKHVCSATFVPNISARA